MFELQENEEIIFSLPQSRFIFFIPSCVLVIFLMIFGYIVFNFFTWMYLFFGLIFIQIIIFWMYSMGVKKQAQSSYVTNQRLILSQGKMLQPEIKSIGLSEIKTLKNFQRGIFSHFFHFGILEITLLSGENIQIQNLSEVEKYTKKIVEILK